MELLPSLLQLIIPNQLVQINLFRFFLNFSTDRWNCSFFDGVVVYDRFHKILHLFSNITDMNARLIKADNYRLLSEEFTSSFHDFATMFCHLFTHHFIWITIQGRFLLLGVFSQWVILKTNTCCRYLKFVKDNYKVCNKHFPLSMIYIQVVILFSVLL